MHIRRHHYMQKETNIFRVPVILQRHLLTKYAGIEVNLTIKSN